jgi:protease IV
MSFKTVSAILRGGWLLDKSWADSHMPLLVSVLKGQGTFAGMRDDEEEDEKDTIPRLVSTQAGAVYRVGYYTDMSRIPEGSIAMIPLTGPLMKYGGMCSYGMIDIVSLLQRVANAQNIKGIILDIDSPGGQVNGTSMLAEFISSISKPVISMVDDGMAASAAIWIGSAADEFYVTKKTDQVGSVGVYATLYDYNGYLEKEGLKVHEIYAPQSKEKNEGFREALQGNYNLIQDELKVIAQEFIDTVAENRSGKIKGDEWKSGKMFYAKDATRIGLIDGIKSFDQVVKRMDQLIKTNSTTSNSNTMAFKKTLTAAKADKFSVVDGGFLLTEENLNNIENNIAASETAAAESSSQLTSANTAKKKAEDDLATANQTITAKDAEISGLKIQLSEAQESAAGEFQETARTKDKTANGDVPFYLSDKDPSNKIADSLFGAPVIAEE